MFGHLLRAVRRGNEPLFQLHKTARNIGYLVWHAGKNHAMVQRARKYELPAEAAHERTVLIRNKQDPWLTPNLDDLKQINPHLEIIEPRMATSPAQT
jgi:hypothetical protein